MALMRMQKSILLFLFGLASTACGDSSSLRSSLTAKLQKNFVHVELLPTDLSPAQEEQVRDTFQRAADTWNSLILTDLPDLVFRFDRNVQGDCGIDHVVKQGTVIDNLLIFAQVENIDGPFNVLGSAGPCRESTFINGFRFPRLGRMRFDSADVLRLLADGTFFGTVLHEMGHVLGIGTFWNRLVSNRGSTDPRYSGSNGVLGFQNIGGTETQGPPVENVGGAGTRDAHWRTDIFGDELMTGFLTGPVQPLSLMTAQSLVDLGYSIDFESPAISRRFAINGAVVKFNGTAFNDDVWWEGADNPLDGDDASKAFSNLLAFSVLAWLLHE